MARCIINGCNNTGIHNFGVRLRRPSTRAIWAPNTEAFICDEHATGGMTIVVELTPNNKHTIETQISSGSRGVTRKTAIKKGAKD